MGRNDYKYLLMKEAVEAKLNGDGANNQYIKEQIKMADPKIRALIKKRASKSGKSNH